MVIRYLIALTLIFQPFLLSAKHVPQEDTTQPKSDKKYPEGIIQEDLLAYCYSGKEKFRYDVSWSGGIKVGELLLEVKALPDVSEGYEIRAHVSTKNGDVHLFYPINDLYVTKVKGPKKLPFHYEIWQKEGYSYEAHKVLTYDQENWLVRHVRNDKLQAEFSLNGEINNEFSSFFNSRMMDFTLGQPFVVPTYADRKREEVAVHPIVEEKIKDTVIGDVSTVAVMPVMKFKGLYEKKGDTVIWYTNDECRVPVKIQSKIIIGSLTAVLKDYDNPACPHYTANNTKNKKGVKEGDI